MSKDVLLMEPTALQALRTTSRLLGSVCDEGQIRKRCKSVQMNDYRHIKAIRPINHSLNHVLS